MSFYLWIASVMNFVNIHVNIYNSIIFHRQHGKPITDHKVTFYSVNTPMFSSSTYSRQLVPVSVQITMQLSNGV